MEGKSPSKRMSVVMSPKLLTSDMDLLVSASSDPDKVNSLYVAVLDHLLTPLHLKEQLLESQSIDKKVQMIKMHNHLFESMNNSQWGEKENALLVSITSKMKLPDIATISRLKIILSTGNMEMMVSFLDSGGPSLLLKAIENRLVKKPLTELDIAILFEILSCCKAIMKSSVGMEGMAIAIQGSIDIIARCLRFDYKAFAMQIIEILSVCSFYSEETAMKVLHAMKEHARYHQEAPFASLSLALVEQDIEVKAAILSFINALIMSVDETKSRFALRAELNAQLFDERLETALHQVDKEVAVLTSNEACPSSPSVVSSVATTTSSPSFPVPTSVVSSEKQRKISRRSMVTMFGPRAEDERKVETMIKNTGEMAVSDRGSIAAKGTEVKSGNGNSVFVNPEDGTMAGKEDVSPISVCSFLCRMLL
jgi:hypothetical protein